MICSVQEQTQEKLTQEERNSLQEVKRGKWRRKKYTTTWTCAENEEARRKRVENGEARRKREENEEARKKTEEHEAAWRASMKGGIQSADTLGGPIDDL